jgi:hypothetical protein
MLSSDEVEHFVEEGYVCVRSAFSPELAGACRNVIASDLGIDLTDPASWDRPVARGPTEGEAFREAANSTPLLEAIGQLVDPDPWAHRPNLGAFVIRFPAEADPGDTGWHIDSSFQPEGDERWFVSYRSRHRALLLLCLLSDVDADDAPTRLLPGSHVAMPTLLFPAGDRGLPGAYEGQRSEIPLPDTSGPVELATGAAGDVFLCHPFLVHAASWPHRGSGPRFITQPPIGMAGSLRVDGPMQRLSPVARAIRRGLEGCPA